MKTFEMKIEELQEELRESLPYLNGGGCGRFAYMLGKKLKREGIDFKVMILGREFESIEPKKISLNNVRNNKSDRNKNNTSFSHCFLEVGGLKFDGLNNTEGLEIEYGHYGVIGEYSLQDLYLAIKVGGWNSRFDLREDLPVLEKIMSDFKC